MTSVTSPLTRLACIAAIAFAGCDRTEQTISGPLKQRGYLWQREWTPAVVDALGEADRRMDGLVILGAEINLAGKKPEIVKATIDWDAVKRQTKHCSIALRVAPFAGPFRSDDASAQAIVDLAKQLISDARAHNVGWWSSNWISIAQPTISETIARGYDRPETVVQPTPFRDHGAAGLVGDSDFRHLIREADAYVLQVHSVPISAGTNAKLCDARLAHEWMMKGSTTRNAVFCGSPNVSLQRRLRSRWKTSQHRDGQRATSLAARDARFGIWGGRR